MATPEDIRKLVEKYTFHRDAYLRGQEKYNETQLRQDFIDPFFHALGWDVNNNKGHSETYREVLLGEPFRVRGKTQYFDYTFRIGGIRKFIVETKKPSVSIKDNADAALQIRWYAWNAKLPLSILTNFEEFAVYDCTRKPSTSDAAAVARIAYFTFREYPEKWDWIVSIFSQECILKGSFDRYAESTKGKKGTASVDDDILAEIESWRDVLAKNIAIRNISLSIDEINAVVQRTIDRIIFLRICEDRGIEEYGTLQKLMEGDGVYARLCDLFRHADEKYNSGLFHFQQEADIREPPDTLSLAVVIDDKVLKGIVKRLYYPDCPYIFSVIPPAILGHVYEQFLGKVIRLTETHQAKVEYKPEVKKAGGVFYTPQYIVEYIVKHTVGELVKDKTPREVAKLRILDPACGSGSFLIGAYQFLIDWHRDWYIGHLVPVYTAKNSVTDPAVLALLPEPAPRGKKKLKQVELPVYPAGKNGDATRTRSDWRLTTAEKKRILLKNIYGVDIDQQAVEVTKLSLLLKVLEEENEENIDKQLKLFAERALPNLDQNIRCGNSLIGWDIMTPDMPADEIKRINPFDWDTEFAAIMKAGGFDAVIGNPPYLNIDDTWGCNDSRLIEIKKQYPEIYNDKTDILFYFLAKGVKLSKGFVSYIVSRAFLEAYKADKLRSYLSSTSAINSIIDFQNFYVFDRVGITTCIISLEPRKIPNITIEYKLIEKKLPFLQLERCLEINTIFEKIEKKQKDLNSEPWIFASNKVDLINKKIDENGKKIGEILAIGKGMETGRNDVFGNRSLEEIKQSNLQIGQYYLRASNSDIQRYFVTNRREYLLYLEEFSNFKDLPDGVQKHLTAHIAELKNRAAYKRGDCEWWKYTWPLHKEWYNRPRLLCPYLAKFNRFAFDKNREFLGLTDTTILFDNGQQEDLKYILGLLNSHLLSFRFQSIGKLKGGGIREYFWNSVSKLPIRTINFSDPLDKARHDRMVTLVTQMLDLNKKLQDARLEQEKTQLSRQIAATDGAIDKLVYELYGLSEEEIKVVEGSAK